MDVKFHYFYMFLRADILNNFSSFGKVIYELLMMFLRLLMLFYLSEYIFERSINTAFNIESYFVYIFSGIVFLDISSSVIPAISKAIMRYKADGIFEELKKLPISTFSMLFYSLSYPVIYSFLKSIIYFIMASYIYGEYIFPLQSLPIYIFMCLLFIVPSIGLSFFMGALFLRDLKPFIFMNTYVFLSIFLGGVFFPVDLLPNYLQIFSYLFPIAFAIESIRELYSVYGPFLNVINSATFLILLSSIYLALGYAFLSQSIIKDRE